MTKLLKLSALFAALAVLGINAQAANKKIVLVAGTPSHGPGEHEHNAGVLLFKKCLNQISGINAVTYTNGWPKDPNAFDGADAIVLYADGGDGHFVLRDDHLAQIDAAMKRGAGLACIHYAVEVPANRGGPEFLKWIGGYFETNWSVNPIWDADFSKLPTHPITRGVKPFKLHDELYYHMRFQSSGVTPILSAVPPDSTREHADDLHGGNPFVRARKGMSEDVAWAYERPDGGRGFGYTGGHYHKNWGNEDLRKLVLNAFLWIAKMDVPQDGVVTKITDEDLEQNLDPKRRRANAGGEAPSASAGKPKYKSGIVQSGLVNVDADITGAKNLYLVVTDGGNGYGCDWADWISPELVKADGSKTKLTSHYWKSAISGWGKAAVGRNAGGGDMKIKNQVYPEGIGTHAPSLIEYELPAGEFKRLTSKAGLDDGGTGQGCGSQVEFMVFVDKPPESVLRVSSADGGQAEHSFGLAAAREDVKKFTTAPGLEVSLFAAEPMLRNPTDMDIDERGRVWITEGVNYRYSIKSWGILDPAGDRIVSLEDTNGDGEADKATTFYQGQDINSALGICVLGNKVIVSRSPDVFVLTDTDGDGKADKKEVLFSGIAGVDHDHGVHAFSFGPDGKLYFNFGNESRQLKDRDGKPIIDSEGNEVKNSGKPYRNGMVLRCNLDGSGVEVLAHNFRNNYEVAVDSFGTLWQSDNDDDGNRAVRINYVMEHGNFGFGDEMTGAGWQVKRSNLEDEIPRRHWHQNDPGVVPNLLITGAGAPTGMAIYEGSLLPAIFHNQMIHCDCGPRVVRSYPVQAEGAGFTAQTVDILTCKDTWFRPSDVCVAPDGSIYVADWNDAVVGGHNMADHDPGKMTGRVYRVAPEGSKPSVPKPDLKSAAGCVQALMSPNLSTRYLAWTALREMGEKGRTELMKLWKIGNPRPRARALYLLAEIPGNAGKAVQLGIKDSIPDLRITALRIAREHAIDVIPLVRQLARDFSAQVRRECAIALRHSPSPDAPQLWAQLALQHDGKDRWYLEALGIGADRQQDKFFAAWLAQVGDNWNTPAGRDIIWRSRASKSADYLVKIIADKSSPETERARCFRAFDFLSGPEKDAALVQLLTVNGAIK